MKKLFLAIIACWVLLPAYSQYVVKGKIMDPENAVMPMVNVAFLNQADPCQRSGIRFLRDIQHIACGGKLYYPLFLSGLQNTV